MKREANAPQGFIDSDSELTVQNSARFLIHEEKKIAAKETRTKVWVVLRRLFVAGGVIAGYVALVLELLK